MAPCNHNLHEYSSGFYALLGVVITLFFQFLLEFYRWFKDEVKETRIRRQESDSAVIKKIYPILENLYNQGLKLKPRVGANLTGSIVFSGSPQTPNEDFMLMAQNLIDSDPFEGILEGGIQTKLKDVLDALQGFLRETLILPQQRNIHERGAVLQETIDKQNKYLMEFLSEFSKFKNLASRKIGFHRFGV
jgi:hypothetical protein